jgi:hypothetical protein
LISSMEHGLKDRSTRPNLADTIHQTQNRVERKLADEILKLF